MKQVVCCVCVIQSGKLKVAAKQAVVSYWYQWDCYLLNWSLSYHILSYHAPLHLHCHPLAKDWRQVFNASFLLSPLHRTHFFQIAPFGDIVLFRCKPNWFLLAVGYGLGLRMVRATTRPCLLLDVDFFNTASSVLPFRSGLAKWKGGASVGGRILFGHYHYSVLPRHPSIVFTCIHCRFIDNYLRHILMSLSHLLFQFRRGIWF